MPINRHRWTKAGGGSGGAGTVTGPASSTDNAIARWDGAGGTTLQNSAVTVADTSGLVTLPLAAGAGIRFYGANNTGALKTDQANTGIIVDCNNTNTYWFSDTSLRTQSSKQYTWTGGADAVAGPDTGLARSAAGVIRSTNGSTGISGFMGGGAAVASAAALPVPTGRVFHVTGTTNVTSITSTNFTSGAVITLIFDDVLTFTDGNNLKLAGNFVTSADDTITLVYDGTNWFEMSRSVN